MKKFTKSFLSCLLVFCMVISYVVPVAALDAGQATLAGAGPNGSSTIRVEKGGDTQVTYTLSYQDPADAKITALGSAYFYLKYEDMTYNLDATCSAGTMDRNDIMNSDKESLKQYNGQIRLVKVAINSPDFTVTVPFTDVQASNTLTLSVKEIFGKTADPRVAPELTYTPSDPVQIIVQNPMNVTITGAQTGNSVSCTTTAFDTGKNTYDQAGTATALATGDTVYVDSGTENATPTFTVTNTDENVLGVVKVNGTDVTKSCTIETSGKTSTVTLPAGVTADTDVEFQFLSNLSTYKVQHFKETAEGTNVYLEAETETLNGSIGATVNAQPKTYAGYTYDSTASGSIVSGTVDAAGNLTLKLYYKANHVEDYTLTFESNGGSAVTPLTEKDGTEIDLSKYTSTRAHYTFGGWYSDEGLTSAVTSVTLTADTKVYAKWEPEQYDLAFETNGGSAVTKVTKAYGETVSLTQTSTRDHYTFSGWYADAALSQKVTSVTMEENTTVYAGWTPLSYTLTFETNGGTAVAAVTDAYGTTVDLTQKTTTKDNSVFGGWYSDAALTKAVSSVTLNGDMTVYAKWGIAQHTLSFETNGGSAVTAVKGDYGDEISLTQVPTKAHYEFLGWYADAALTNKVTTISLTGDMTVYAGWKLEQHTLTFETDGGTAVPAVQEDYGTAVTLSQTTSKQYYTFDGWYTDAGLTEKATTVTLDADKTVYAKWTRDQYTLTFETNGGTAVAPMTVDAGSTPNLPMTSKDGFTFSAWYTGSNLAEKYVAAPVTADMTLYAGWTENLPSTFTLSFNTNGGSAVTSVTKDEGSVVALDQTTTRLYHTFTGWYADEGLTQKVTSVTLDSNKTVYAGWTEDQYTLTFNTNGGTAIDPITNAGGTQVVLGQATTKEHYTFGGWYADAACTQKITTVTLTEDTTVYAAWTPASYTLTFETNGGSSVNAVTANYGQTIDLSAYGTSKTGYFFTGWYSDNALTESIFDVQLAGDTTVYAGWLPLPYVLTFEANGGSAVDTVSGFYGETIDLTQSTQKDGFTFTGWYLDAALTQKATSLVLTDNTTVYAGWEQDAPTKVTVTLDNGDGTTTKIEANVGDVIPLTPLPNRDGYTFDGWYSDPEHKNPVTSVTASKDTTIYAGWEKDAPTKVTVTLDNGDGTTTKIEANVGDVIPLTPPADRDGYTFDGWYSDPEHKNPVTSVTASKDTTIYAGWEQDVPTKVIVTLDNGDGTTTKIEANVGDVIPLTPPANRDDYTFGGWYSDPEHKNPVTSVTASEDTTVYAEWIPAQYTLTYETNGGSTVATVRESAGTVVTLSQTPTKDGYTFSGWYADAALTQKIDTVTMTGDKTVYAGWTKAATFTLSFSVNGGNDVTPVTAPAGTAVPLTQTSAKSGYAFNGWYADAALTQKVETVTLNADMTVYAGWIIFDTNHVAYIQGYPDGTVRPTKSISRAEVATIFYRLLAEDVRNQYTTEANNFSDVSASNWFNKEVSTLAAMGVLTGYPDGTFGPNKPITRAEFATLTVRFVDAPETTENPFSDISGHWAENNIKRAAAAKLVEGSNGKFRPGDNITRAEAMTVVNRLLHRLPETPEDLSAGLTTFTDVPASAWYYLAVEEATNTHDHEMKADGIHEKWTGLK